MQAIILAAGMGTRLNELTKDKTKCMVEINQVTLIKRMLSQLDTLNLTKVVLVIGYKKEKLKTYIKTLDIKTKIEYVDNDIFYKTNNIYSLYLARHYLLKEDTLLIESDIIFEDSILTKIINNPYPSLALVAKYENWMYGTVVTLDENKNILRFLEKENIQFNEIDEYYKTVNIYKFSKEFSNSHYVPFLEAYSKALGDNEYYEQVLKVITLLKKPEIKAIVLEQEAWYEIDDIQDLDIAETIFANSTKEKLIKMQKRYGGYWRYPKLIDFCYLVNPFYPPTRLLDEIKVNFKNLMCQYPSGAEINSLLAANYFNLDIKQICVGNGAAELIKALLLTIPGKSGVIYPTFEEYPNRKTDEEVVGFYPTNNNYSYTANELINFFENKDITSLILINPDNPSGNYIAKDDVLRISKWALKKNIKFIVDESFVDFIDKEESGTLLLRTTLEEHPNLIVIKSISKSFGVPGLRLGIIASSDLDIISHLKKDVSIWNINSFAEFYLQIFEKYKPNYKEALIKFKQVRKKHIKDLETIKNLRVIPTQANYVLCELLGKTTSQQLAEILLDKYNILIKELSHKKGIKGQFIRVAVKKRAENEKLIKAIKDILK